MAFDITHYPLKYYHEHTNDHGQVVRLEIRQYIENPPTPAIPAKVIKGLSSLHLEVQGGSDPIDAAIVKTSLAFSLVDQWDKPASLREKCGNWQEFYTPNSTGYLVQVKVADVTRWSGYITPDAWEESLDYYGSVSVTARDNIGHLQDFAFDMQGDADGLVRLRALIAAAFDKVAFPMGLYISDDPQQGFHTLQQGGVDLLDAFVNVEAFEGDNWYNALETALGDLGCCLRYVDNNAFVVTALRNLPQMGWQDFASVPRRTPIFLGGNLRLDPAYKSITDDLAYDVQDEVAAGWNNTPIMEGTTTTAPFTIYSADGSTHFSGLSQISYTLSPTDGKGWIATAGVLDAQRYGVHPDTAKTYGIDTRHAVMVATNLTAGTHAVAFAFGVVHDSAIKITLSCCPSVLGLETYAGAQRWWATDAFVRSFQYRIYLRKGANTYYWNNSAKAWDESTRTNNYDVEQNSEAVTFDLSAGFSTAPITDALLYLEITNVIAVYNYVARAPYWCITDVLIESTGSRVARNVVRSVNNETYNIENVKQVKLGVISKAVSWATCKTYRNVLYTRDDAGVVSMLGYDWQWDDASEAFPLPALIHLQRLAYHSDATKVINGDFVLQGQQPQFDALYAYKDSVYLLQGGTIDLLRGRCNDATLVCLDNWIG